MNRIALFALLVAGCGGTTALRPAGGPAACAGGTTERAVTFSSADGLVIHGTLANPCGGSPRPVVVLAHQMCTSRAEWSEPAHDWIGALHARGVATLAIDLRGHGQSTRWPDGSTHDLCAEWEDEAAGERYAPMVEDVRAAVSFARTDARAPAVAIVGSSIGANSALVVFGDDPAIAAAVALSPGLDYRGIQPADAVLRAGARPLVLFGADDDEVSATAVRELGAAAPTARAEVFPTGGHGNAILDAHPDELARLVSLVTDALFASR